MTNDRKRPNIPVLIEGDSDHPDEPAKKRTKRTSECAITSSSQPSSSKLVSDAFNLLLLSKMPKKMLIVTDSKKDGQDQINILSDDEDDGEARNRLSGCKEHETRVYKSDSFNLPERLQSGKRSIDIRFPKLPIGRPLPIPPRLPKMSPKTRISQIFDEVLSTVLKGES